jgi:NAD(P)H-hydrate epimerase
MKDTVCLLSARQAKALDYKAREKFGIPTLVLMENAGIAIATAAAKAYQKHPGIIVVICGSGNNGGDGFCAARHLLCRGFKPAVYLAGKINHVKNEAQANLAAWLKLKQKITEIKPANLGRIKKILNKSGLIIDALLGVGVRGQIRPLWQEIIDSINSAGRYVLAVDIPSGLDAANGRLLGRCVKADMTVTFVAKKRGMASSAGKCHCGRIVVRGIGLPNRYLINY